MSSFHAFSACSLYELLIAIEFQLKNSANENQLPNLLRRNTVGLRFAHDSIIQGISNGQPTAPYKPQPIRPRIVNQLYRTEKSEEIMTPGDGLSPIDHSHYALVTGVKGPLNSTDSLGLGQFSSVHNGVDLYHQVSPSTSSLESSSFAIKIVPNRFKILALREVELLKFWKQSTTARYFAHLVDSFQSRDNYYLVLQKCSFTLQQFIPKRETSSVNVGHNNISETLYNRSNGNNTSDTSFNHIKLQDTVDSNNRCQRFIDNVRNIAETLLISCAYMHSEGVIHGDIKPENIFIEVAPHIREELQPKSRLFNHYRAQSENGRIRASLQNSHSREISSESCNLLTQLCPVSDYRIRVGDFGSSLCVEEIFTLYCKPQHDSTNANGSNKHSYTIKECAIQPLSHRAPEVLMGEYQYTTPSSSTHSTAESILPFNTPIDIWSIGIVILELCLGYNLFTACTVAEQIRALGEKLWIPSRSNYTNIHSNGERVESLESKGSVMLHPFQNNGHKSVTVPTLTDMANYFIKIKHLLLSSSIYRDIEAICTPLFIQFLARCLHPLPAYRLTALDALQHPYVHGSIPATLVNSIINRRDVKTIDPLVLSVGKNRSIHMLRQNSLSVNTKSTSVAAAHLSSSQPEQPVVKQQSVLVDNTLDNISNIIKNLNASKLKGNIAPVTSAVVKLENNMSVNSSAKVGNANGHVVMHDDHSDVDDESPQLQRRHNSNHDQYLGVMRKRKLVNYQDPGDDSDDDNHNEEEDATVMFAESDSHHSRSRHNREQHHQRAVNGSVTKEYRGNSKRISHGVSQFESIQPTQVSDSDVVSASSISVLELISTPSESVNVITTQHSGGKSRMAKRSNIFEIL